MYAFKEVYIIIKNIKKVSFSYLVFNVSPDIIIDSFWKWPNIM